MEKHDDVWLPYPRLERRLAERPESGVVDEMGNPDSYDDWEKVYEGVEWE